MDEAAGKADDPRCAADVLDPAGDLQLLLSQSLGSYPSVLKAGAFTLSAALAGLAGALYPVLNGRVSTANFTVWLSILLLLMVVLGGLISIRKMTRS